MIEAEILEVETQRTPSVGAERVQDSAITDIEVDHNLIYGETASDIFPAEMSEDLKKTIVEAVDLGNLSIVPPRTDGTKRPLPNSWKQYQDAPASKEQVFEWYRSGTTGLGIVCGSVSDNLECLDFDERDIHGAWRDLAHELGCKDLVERIEEAYMEHSPNGVHLLYRCSDIGGSTKLATRPKLPEEKKDDNDNTKTLIETRGEGGYIIVAPTYGGVNPAGDYVLKSGTLGSIPTISPEERNQIHIIAKLLHQTSEDNTREELSSATATEDDQRKKRPGDIFNNEASWESILVPHGWVLVKELYGKQFFRRPGKTTGISATVNWRGNGLLHVFTSATAFESNKSYSKFTAHTILNHSGDFSEAASVLAKIQKQTADNYESPVIRDIYSYLTEAYKYSLMDLKQEYLLDGLIPRNMIILFYANSGMGKSTIMAQICHAIQEGDKFLGLGTRKTNCVVIDYENSKPVICDRMRKLSGQPKFYIWDSTTSNQPRMDSDDFVDYFSSLKSETLIVIDTLRSCQSADENDSKAILSLFDKLKKLRNDGHTIVVLDHTTKASNDTYRGSSAKQDLADHTMVMYKANQGSKKAVNDSETYYIGTGDKTRAKPFCTYLQFNTETKLFELAENPENIIVNAIKNTIESLGGKANQSEIVEYITNNDDLNFGEKKIISFLKENDGVHWSSVSGVKNAKIYSVIGS